MLWFGKRTCFFCNRRVPAKDTLRRRGIGEVVVCVTCLEKWERDGRSCLACHTTVHGPQDIAAFFMPRYWLGHADCGGIRLTRR